MSNKKRAANATPSTHNAKISITKDICKVLEYFQYKVGTSLDCAIATGILRNSVTWYISDLEEEGLLQAIARSKDSTTGFTANHYSADRSKWVQRGPVQLSLFGEGLL